MMTSTNPGKRNANRIARGTIPGFTAVCTPVAFPVIPSASTRIKLAMSASIVAPQGHAITVALRTMLAQRVVIRNYQNLVASTIR